MATSPALKAGSVILKHIEAPSMKMAMNGKVMSNHLRRPSVSILLTAGNANKKFMVPWEVSKKSTDTTAWGSNQNQDCIPSQRGFCAMCPRLELRWRIAAPNRTPKRWLYPCFVMHLSEIIAVHAYLPPHSCWDKLTTQEDITALYNLLRRNNWKKLIAKSRMTHLKAGEGLANGSALPAPICARSSDLWITYKSLSAWSCACFSNFALTLKVVTQYTYLSISQLKEHLISLVDIVVRAFHEVVSRWLWTEQRNNN